MTADTLKSDLIAGLVVSLVALPLAMSFAISIGVSPEYGLYAAIVGGILAALFGGSDVNVTGPTGAFVAVLSGVVLKFGYEKLLLAGLLAGLLLLVAGLFRLGKLISYIPYPVTIGFTSGIAVLIFTSQLGNIFGLQGLTRHEFFHENIWEVATHLTAFSPFAVAIAVLTAAIMVIIPRFHRSVPAALVGVAVAALITSALSLHIPTILSVFGGIPRTLPSLALPSYTFADVRAVLPSAFVIATLGAIESLLSCVVSDSMTGKRHDSNAELIGQGIANIAVPFVGGIPVTGAIARTAVNVKSGAQSRLASIFHGVLLAVIMLVAAPLVNTVPLAALGGVLAVVAYRMAELKHIKELLRHGDRSDVAVLIVTLLLTIFVDLTVSITVGLGLAALLFMKRISELGVTLTAVDRSGAEPRFVPTSGQLQCPHLSIYTLQGPLFFGAARSLVAALHGIEHAGAILLRLKYVPLIDSTGFTALREIIATQGKKHPIYLSGVQPQVLQELKNAGIDVLLGKNRIFADSRDAINCALRDQGLTDGCEEYRIRA